MALLHVQPKKAKSILPWILLILVAMALVWFMFYPARTSDEGHVRPGNQPGTQGMPLRQ